jgi:hypothetical protein
MAVAFPYINDPKYWRERSEEARSIAKLLDDPEAKRQILDIAAGYDRLSEHMKQLQKQLTSREHNAMPTADDCRRNAAECLQALKLATKDEVRSALITWHSAGTNLPTTRNESKRGCRVSRGTSCRESAAPRTKAQS